jgi:hypothetical protein
MNGLALDGGVGIGRLDERARAANDNFFEQVEEGDAAFTLAGGASGGEKIFLQVADTGGGEVAAVAAGEEVNLVVEVKDGVVDGSRGQQNQFLALAADGSATIISSQNTLKRTVALGAAIAEVVALINEEDIRVLHYANVKFLAAKRFLSNDAGSDGGALQFGFPHTLQSGGADDDGTVALVIGMSSSSFLPIQVLPRPTLSAISTPS